MARDEEKKNRGKWRKGEGGQGRVLERRRLERRAKRLAETHDRHKPVTKVLLKQTTEQDLKLAKLFAERQAIYAENKDLDRKRRQNKRRLDAITLLVKERKQELKQLAKGE